MLEQKFGSCLNGFGRLQHGLERLKTATGRLENRFGRLETGSRRLGNGFGRLQNSLGDLNIGVGGSKMTFGSYRMGLLVGQLHGRKESNRSLPKRNPYETPSAVRTLPVTSVSRANTTGGPYLTEPGRRVA